MNLYALHGFLGNSEDWRWLGPKLADNVRLRAVDIYASGLTSPQHGLQKWGQSFNTLISPSEVNIVMGYSLGGRLAMHAMLAQPQLWRAAIIISAHPGGLTPSEKQKRQASDAHWAKRFAEEPLGEVIEDWNAQPVFNGSKHLPRDNQALDRQRLAETLQWWSLRRQVDLRPVISAFELPILWITGRHDIAAMRRTEELKLAHADSKIWIAPAGHRVPWDQPKLFLDQLTQFLQSQLLPFYTTQRSSP